MTSSEKLIIDTPELITLEYAVAGIGSRFLALAIDTTIQAVATAVIFLPIIFFHGYEAGVWLRAVAVVAYFCLYYGYFAVFEAAWRGQTPGKRRIGLRVVKESGQPIDTSDAVVRNLLRLVDQFPGVYAIGILSAFLSNLGKRLGDHAAGTVVVRERGSTDGMPAWWNDADTRGGPLEGVSSLSAQEIGLIEAFLARREQLGMEVRASWASAIAGRLKPRLGPVPEGLSEPERLLEAIVGEYRRLHRYS